jgi:hypothetical protein
MLALLTTLALSGAQPAQPSVSIVAPCRAQRVHAATPPPMQGRKLGELPPGVLQLAVDKRVGGCSVTVLPTRGADGRHRTMPHEAAGVGWAEQPLSGQRRPERRR